LDIRNDKQEGEKWIREAAERAAGGQDENSPSSPAAGEKGPGKNGEKTKKSPGLSLLDKEPRDISIILPQDGEEEGTKKTKKKSSKKKKKADRAEEIETLVNGLLTSIFAIAATKDPEVWTVTQPEVESISEPAAKIIAKMDKAGKVGEYADGLSLLLAVLIVVGSRVVKTAQKRKPKEGIKIERTTRYERPSQNDNRKNNSSAEPAPHVDNAFTDVLPAVG